MTLAHVSQIKMLFVIAQRAADVVPAAQLTDDCAAWDACLFAFRQDHSDPSSQMCGHMWTPGEIPADWRKIFKPEKPQNWSEWKIRCSWRIKYSLKVFVNRKCVQIKFKNSTLITHFLTYTCLLCRFSFSHNKWLIFECLCGPFHVSVWLILCATLTSAGGCVFCRRSCSMILSFSAWLQRSFFSWTSRAATRVSLSFLQFSIVFSFSSSCDSWTWAGEALWVSCF